MLHVALRPFTGRACFPLRRSRTLPPRVRRSPAALPPSLSPPPELTDRSPRAANTGRVTKTGVGRRVQQKCSVARSEHGGQAGSDSTGRGRGASGTGRVVAAAKAKCTEAAGASWGAAGSPVLLLLRRERGRVVAGCVPAQAGLGRGVPGGEAARHAAHSSLPLPLPSLPPPHQRAEAVADLLVQRPELGLERLLALRRVLKLLGAAACGRAAAGEGMRGLRSLCVMDAQLRGTAAGAALAPQCLCSMGSERSAPQLVQQVSQPRLDHVVRDLAAALLGGVDG